MAQQLIFSEPRPSRPPRHLADLDEAGRASAVAELGLPAFRAKQLAHQYYGRLIGDPRQMTDLPASVRDRIAEAMFPGLLAAASEVTCDAGQTRKTLWRALDGATVESVLMRYPQRNTVCISSQAGCGMACPFCATGQGGLTRNLSTAEILEQVRAGAAALRDDFGPVGQRLSNVVFMGMGEPLANYVRVLGAVRRIIAPPPHGFGISARSVTVSTVGLVPAIRKLADERLGVTLALSLHAPDDELRDTLVPVNNRWKIAEALDAARYYAEVTGRRVSVEYALIRDVNDHPVAGRPARSAAASCAGAVGAREPDPAQSDPGQRLGCQPQGGGAGVRSAGPVEGRFVHGARHPRPRDQCRLRTAGRRGRVAGAQAIQQGPADSWPPKAGLPDPAAPAAPQVADQEKQAQRGKPDQEQVLDMPDVVAAQHRQQEYDAESADKTPGAVIDPAPAPRC